MFYWSESLTSLVRFWQPAALTRLTLTPLDFTTDLRHWLQLLDYKRRCRSYRCYFFLDRRLMTLIAAAAAAATHRLVRTHRFACHATCV